MFAGVGCWRGWSAIIMRACMNAPPNAALHAIYARLGSKDPWKQEASCILNLAAPHGGQRRHASALYIIVQAYPIRVKQASDRSMISHVLAQQVTAAM